MKNVDLENSIKAAHSLVEEIVAKAKVLQGNLENNRKDEQVVEQAHRAVLSGIHERNTEIVEELDQMKRALNGPSEPEPEPELVPEEDHDNDSSHSDEEEEGPEPDDLTTTGTVTQPVVRPDDSPEQSDQGFFVMPLTGREWLFALLGLVLAVIVWAITRHLIVSSLSATGRNILGIFWFLALVSTGFFSGGLIGRRMSEVQTSRPARSSRR